MSAPKMIGIFVLLYTFFAALAGLFQLNRYQLSGIMLLFTFGVAVWYLGTRHEPENKADELSAGDWLLGTGASLFSLTLFSGNTSLWLTISTGAVIVLLSAIYDHYYNRHAIGTIDCYGSTVACQLIGPLPIMLAAWADWWNLAVAGVTIVIVLFICGMLSLDDVGFELADYNS